MIKIEAFYYDGRSSARIPVSVSFQASGAVVIQGETTRVDTRLEDLTISARLGNTHRSLFLPDGSKLETGDNDAIDNVCHAFAKNPWHAVLHKLEQRWLYVLSAIVIAAGFIWAGIEYGVPVAALWTAKAIPPSVEQKVGEQGLTSLDHWLFSESEIGPDEQNRLQQRFSQLITKAAGGPYHYRLLLRGSQKMGANALALPGGIVVVTDGLVELAENDDQIMAALAHEIGHVEYQHGIRSILQDSLTAILMIGLLGDISSVSSLSATLPTVLVESRYSRQFEQEADLYAVELLQKQGIAPEQFVEILALLEKSHGTGFEFDYLSSHPAMDKRIAIIESLKER